MVTPTIPEAGVADPACSAQPKSIAPAAAITAAGTRIRIHFGRTPSPEGSQDCALPHGHGPWSHPGSHTSASECMQLKEYDPVGQVVALFIGEWAGTSSHRVPARSHPHRMRGSTLPLVGLYSSLHDRPIARPNPLGHSTRPATAHGTTGNTRSGRARVDHPAARRR